MTTPQHWDKVYTTYAADEVSWFQPHAEQSLALLEHAGATPESRIIDVGGGASTLVDDLVAEGYRHLSVLDLSAAALAVARARLGPAGDGVAWIVGDVTQVELAPASIDIWHDRAVFHFLTDPAQRAAYVAQVRRAVKPGGHVIVATFGPDGPLECSGLPVVRYAPEALHSEFDRFGHDRHDFELLEHATEVHQTPSGKLQHFVYCHCLKPH